MNNINGKKLIILISILIVVLLGVSAYVAWQGRNARRAGGSAPAPNMTEEDILRSLAPLTARELSAEEMAKEKEILKQLAPASKLSPIDAEKEKEILKSLTL